jgi:hypothetical protein
MSGVHQAGDAGTGWTTPLRMAIVCRGAGYGYLAGLVSGAVTGGVLAWPEPSALAGIVILAGIVGGFVGWAFGVIGGALFASAAPCLARRTCAARLAGAAVVPVILFVGIGAFTKGDMNSAGSFVAESRDGLAIVSALGIAGGALVGRRVLYGKYPRPSSAEDDGAPSGGGDGADSPE